MFVSFHGKYHFHLLVEMKINSRIPNKSGVLQGLKNEIAVLYTRIETKNNALQNNIYLTKICIHIIKYVCYRVCLFRGGRILGNENLQSLGAHLRLLHWN